MSKWVFWAKLWMNLCFYSGGKSSRTSTFLDDGCWLIIRSLLEKSLKVQGRSQVIQCFFHEVWNICFQNLSALADAKRWINTLWINIRYTVPNMLSGHDTDWSFTGVMIYCNRVFDLTNIIFLKHMGLTSSIFFPYRGNLRLQVSYKDSFPVDHFCVDLRA